MLHVKHADFRDSWRNLAEIHAARPPPDALGGGWRRWCRWNGRRGLRTGCAQGDKHAAPRYAGRTIHKPTGDPGMSVIQPHHRAHDHCRCCGQRALGLANLWWPSVDAEHASREQHQAQRGPDIGYLRVCLSCAERLVEAAKESIERERRDLRRVA